MAGGVKEIVEFDLTAKERKALKRVLPRSFESKSNKERFAGKGKP